MEIAVSPHGLIAESNDCEKAIKIDHLRANTNLKNEGIFQRFCGRCQSKLKIHGQLELKGTTVVQYDSGCSDGTEWHGMFHFWNGKAVSTGLHGPAGAKGVLEPYYYSFSI
jgi:hypothetical protein